MIDVLSPLCQFSTRLFLSKFFVTFQSSLKSDNTSSKSCISSGLNFDFLNICNFFVFRLVEKKTKERATPVKYWINFKIFNHQG